jgi:hypothetical protein
MRRVAKLLAAAALAAITGSASANFIITDQVVPGTGALAGYDIHRLFVQNDGQGTQTAGEPAATQNNVIGLDLTVTAAAGNVIPAGKQQFWFWKTSATAVSPGGAGIFNTAESVGLTYTEAANKTGFVAGDTFGSATNGGQGSFLAPVGPTALGSDYAPNSNSPWLLGTQTPIGNSNATYSTTTSFRTAGSYSFSTANGNANDAFVGKVRFGNVIVPTGNNFAITGTFGQKGGFVPGTLANQVAFSTSAAIPEPASIGLVGLAMMALGRRRRTA